ncbi:MAG: T9SS type A sorting domain-containing protein, partial [Bacteroidia bacterium]|nr:T9SS type A sorting domain-containing protein [Bacteroidia bacterium]
VVQEIVDRPGWTTSSALVIFLDGTGVRTATAYEASPANSPKIFVEYQPSGGGARKAAIQQLETAPELVLYPNPFEDEFFLKAEITGAEWMDITIFNPLGQVVYSEKHLSVRKPVRIQPYLAPGIYSVVVRTDNGQIRHIRSMKN